MEQEVWLVPSGILVGILFLFAGFTIIIAEFQNNVSKSSASETNIILCLFGTALIIGGASTVLYSIYSPA